MSDAVNLTTTEDYDPFAAIASLEADGWLVAWTDASAGLSSGDLPAVHQAFDLDTGALVAGTLQSYPQKVSGNTQYVFSVSAYVPTAATVPQTVGITFRDTGTPPHLRPANGGAGLSADLFIVLGEYGIVPTPLGLNITTVEINGGVEIDMSALPATVNVDVTIYNDDDTDTLTVAAISCTANPAPGFTLATPPTLPVDVGPMDSEVFTFTFTLNSTSMVAGNVTFEVSADGTLGVGATAVTHSRSGILTVTEPGNASIQSVTINGGAPLDMSVSPAPVSISMVVSVENTDTAADLTVTDIIVTAPSGFIETGSITPDIATTVIAPGVTTDFTLTFNITASALTNGSAVFSVTVEGMLGTTAAPGDNVPDATLTVTGVATTTSDGRVLAAAGGGMCALTGPIALPLAALAALALMLAGAGVRRRGA